MLAQPILARGNAPDFRCAMCAMCEYCQPLASCAVFCYLMRHNDNAETLARRSRRGLLLNPATAPDPCGTGLAGLKRCLQLERLQLLSVTPQE